MVKQEIWRVFNIGPNKHAIIDPNTDNNKINVVGLLAGIVWIIISSLLLYGINQKNSTLMLIWIVIEMITNVVRISKLHDGFSLLGH